MGPALDDLSVVGKRGPDLLRLWLGDDAVRDRFSGDLSRLIRHAPASGRDVADHMGAFPHHVRRRHDQDALRPVLARFDLSLLPLRDAAIAKPVELVSPPFTALDAQG